MTIYNLKNIKDNHITTPCCFPVGTQVALSSGEHKNIEDIVVGDFVRTWNEEEGDYSCGEVTELHFSTQLSDHIPENEKAGQSGLGYFELNGEIRFTPEHPFLTKEGWKAIVPDTTREPFLTQEPKVLTEGDFVRCEGDWLPVGVLSFVTASEDETVYNFTVEPSHSYIVEGVVVHNK